MKKVYLEKRDSEKFESDFEVVASSSLGDGEEFTTLNSGMEEDLGLDDLASLIQLELDNYTSCFNDMLDMHNENNELPKNFFMDEEEESPSHSISYEYVIPPTLLHEDLSKPKTTSGWTLGTVDTLNFIYLMGSISVIVENSLYTGHNKTRTVIAKKSDYSPPVARRSQGYYEGNTIIPPRHRPKVSSIEKQPCDSTVKDPDPKMEKRKLFSCDFDGCNKKYTKLSHLKVMISDKTRFLIEIPTLL